MAILFFIFGFEVFHLRRIDVEILLKVIVFLIISFLVFIEFFILEVCIGLISM